MAKECDGNRLSYVHFSLNANNSYDTSIARVKESLAVSYNTGYFNAIKATVINERYSSGESFYNRSHGESYTDE